MREEEQRNALTCMVLTDFYIEGKIRFFFFIFFKALNKKIHKLVCVCARARVYVRTQVSLGLKQH